MEKSGVLGRPSDVEGAFEPSYLQRIEAALELALESELEHVHDLEVTVQAKQRFIRLLAAAVPIVRYHAEHVTMGTDQVCIPRELLDTLTRVTAEVTGV